MSSQILETKSPQAQKDIEVLEQKIESFHLGQIPEERFKAYRLTRGVYGQRQEGVQMIRIKIPYGRLSGAQLKRIADISDEYSNGNLHATTRQNFQLHYVKLDDSPQVWSKLEEVGVTLRESCGNTVRNITASAKAGIDPKEPFDVSPYAEAVFQYFLRNAICQDMGRKIKPAFSSSEEDSAYTYIHDFGFIPRLKDGRRGFKVVLGGGLGAQAMIAQTAYEFLPEDQLIPFMDATIRVFDRFGEREKRHKARMKYLLEPKRGIGLEKLLELVEAEKAGLSFQSYDIDKSIYPETEIPIEKGISGSYFVDEIKYQDWFETNVFEQKQKGFYGINIKLELGNISSVTARGLAEAIDGYVADDIRVTVNQGLQLKYARKEVLPYLYYKLDELGLAASGFGSIADITACPGTDTCNLGVTNSSGISLELEKLIRSEFPDLVKDADIKIKISGCMNSCGQHMVANIGFHGSSIKNGGNVIPALQVVIGGGVDANGRGFIADKVIKLPTKRIPQAVRILLSDFNENGLEGEYFNDYYQRYRKIYFYDLLKHLADLSTIQPEEYIDWGTDKDYIPEIGVGECAGVSYDMVGTIVGDAQERLTFAEQGLTNGNYGDAIYNSYSACVIGAKALLLSKDVSCNTHSRIITDFDAHFVNTGEFDFPNGFENQVLQINKKAPTQEFAWEYFDQATNFLKALVKIRGRQIEGNADLESKLVIDKFYKA